MAIIRYLHLGLTAACNLNCKHCFIKEKESKELSFEKAIAFIDVLEKQGLTHIYYTYGEPLLYHRLFEFSKNIRLKGIYQVLMTNGTQINYEVAQKIAASGINRVMISIDSSIEKKHDMNRGKQGSFGLAVQAIQLLKEQKVNVGIASTITKQNYLELAAIEKLAQENQIQYISFLACREQNRIACPLEKEYIDFVLNSIIENKQYAFHDLRLIPLATFNTIKVYPGTPLYDNPDQYGILAEDMMWFENPDWNKRPMIYTKDLSPEQIAFYSRKMMVDMLI